MSAQCTALLLIVNSVTSVNCAVEQGRLLTVRQRIGPPWLQDILKSATHDIQKASLEYGLVVFKKQQARKYLPYTPLVNRNKFDKLYSWAKGIINEIQKVLIQPFVFTLPKLIPITCNIIQYHKNSIENRIQVNAWQPFLVDIFGEFLENKFCLFLSK